MNQENAQVVGEAVIASAASKAMYGGAGGAVVAWFASSEAAVILGLVIGAAGLAVNTYFQWKRDAREQREHELRLSALEHNAAEE
jgi:hypothetical protein